MDNGGPEYSGSTMTTDTTSDVIAYKLGNVNAGCKKKNKKHQCDVSKALLAPSENRDESKIAIKKALQGRYRHGKKTDTSEH